MSTVELKLRKRHPHGKMNFGRHVVKPEFQEFEINEREEKILKSAEAEAWFISKEEYEAEQEEIAETARLLEEEAGLKDPEGDDDSGDDDSDDDSDKTNNDTSDLFEEDGVTPKNKGGRPTKADKQKNIDKD
jgi:PHD/YefM family antitoxin component YafN of YafNO toxin-antitoxin module